MLMQDGLKALSDDEGRPSTSSSSSGRSNTGSNDGNGIDYSSQDDEDQSNVNTHVASEEDISFLSVFANRFKMNNTTPPHHLSDDCHKHNHPTPNYYDWSSIFPQLKVLRDNIDVLRGETELIRDNWTPWPEEHYSRGGVSTDWTVFPFLHTFPAYNPDKSVWLGSTCGLCSKTAALLRGVDGIRTALFSKLGAGTVLSSHTGWSDLANYVLRCHVSLHIPREEGSCGLVVDGEIAYHAQGEILVFDDSKSHKAFNNSQEDRVVLIVDIVRPAHVPLGQAVGGHTEQLDAFISRFR